MGRRRFLSAPSPVVLLTVLALACGPGDRSSAADEAAGPPADLPEPSGELSCRPLDPDPSGREPTGLFPTADTGFGILYARDRVVELRSDVSGRVRTVAFEREGPLGVVEAAGAALLGDSLLVLADRPRGRLKLITPDGRDGGSVELGFPPQAVAVAGGRLYASPFVLEPGSGPLLWRVEPGARERPVRPIGVDPLPASDPGWTTLGNLVALAAGGDGRLLLAHRLARARAFTVGPADADPRPFRLSMTAREATRLGVRPPTPFGEEALDRIAVPVVAAAGAHGPSSLAYLTRSGRQTADGRFEKLLVRVDAAGRVEAVRRIPFDARSLVALPDARLWVLSDAETVRACVEPRSPE